MASKNYFRGKHLIMIIRIHSNNDYITITYYKIDFIRIKRLLDYIKIDNISILYDLSNKYAFDKTISIDDFLGYISNISTSFIMFDGSVQSCLIDKELDILKNRKLFVAIDYFENMTTIFINKNNLTITKEEIKKIFK